MAEYYPSKKLITSVGELKFVETFSYPNGGYTEFFANSKYSIALDFGICNPPKKNENPFDYYLITQKQNFYMNKYQYFFRFLNDEIDEIDKTLSELNSFDFENYFSKKSRVNRQITDSSPLEFSFEENFLSVYGAESLKYLFKEYEIYDSNGNSFFLDYLVKSKNWIKAVEENGIHYHHPQFIGKERYKIQLQKQNVCTIWGIKLFRFSTEDCQFTQRIQDDIKSFFGNSTDGFIENKILMNRSFKLYEHQEETLKEIEQKRKEGIKSFLIVFPTASGKSKIVEEDLIIFSKASELSALILVPNNAVKNDWISRINNSLSTLKSNIEIQTYSFAIRNYSSNRNDKFNYIVVDEAHHAVAPILSNVIQFYTPQFLIGLTATPDRLDKKSLEKVFSSYKTNLSLEEAMNKKIIAEAKVYRIETNLNLSEIRINGKDYVNSDLEKSIRVTSRNELIAQVLKKYFCENESLKMQGVIFCVNVNHANEMAKTLNQYELNAAAVTSKNANSQKIIEDFKNKKIRFLCSCNMINEGWDYPELQILVMARPTLSKVLYLQQIGRGLRKTDSKKEVFVIDVVDQYGSAIIPCSMHSIFHLNSYVPFGSIIKRDYKLGDFIEINGLFEKIERIIPVDTTSFQEKYEGFLSVEQVAREYFVSNDTIISWLKKEKLKPDASFIFGSKKIFLFSPENVQKSKETLGIKEHNDQTIYEDFFDFLKERDYSLSYKMPFLLGLIDSLNQNGDAKIDKILDYYISFYTKRIEKGLIVDRKTCPYTKELLQNRSEIKRSMLSNPFEKFERKRFMYYSKDLELISLNHTLFSKLTQQDIKNIKTQMTQDLKNYYESLGSTHISTEIYEIEEHLLKVAAPNNLKLSKTT